MSEVTEGTVVPRSFRSMFGHFVAAAAITITIFSAQIAFLTVNTGTTTELSQDTLDLDSVMQIFAHQMPTSGIGVASSATDGGPVAHYGTVHADYDSDTAAVSVTSLSPNVGSETFVFSDRFEDLDSDTIDRLIIDGSSGATNNNDNHYQANCEAHIDPTDGAQAPGAMVGSLGIPTLKDQKTGTGVFTTTHTTAVPPSVITTRNMLAIDGCARMDFQDELHIGSDEHATMSLTRINGVKHGFRVGAYLADYHPFATMKEDTLSVRCLALEPMDPVVAGTCSIFQTETQIKQGLANAETQRKTAQDDADGTDGSDGAIAGADPYNDRNRLKVGNLKGAANRAKNCPIICDPRDESDYMEDRAEMPFGTHVVKATGTETKKCIAGIDRAIEETLKQDEFSTTNIIASIIRSKPLADSISKDLGVTNNWAIAGYILAGIFLGVSFWSLFTNSDSGDKRNIWWSRTIMVLFILLSFIIWVVVAESIGSYVDDKESTELNNVAGCFGSLQSSGESGNLLVTAAFATVVPSLVLIPVLGLIVFAAPWFFMWVAGSLVLPEGQNQFFNMMGWSWKGGTYPINLAAGQASDAADPVMGLFYGPDGKTLRG